MLVSNRCRIGVDDGCDKRWLASWLQFVPMPALSVNEMPVPACPPPIATHMMTRPASCGDTLLNEHLPRAHRWSVRVNLFRLSAWARLDDVLRSLVEDSLSSC